MTWATWIMSAAAPHHLYRQTDSRYNTRGTLDSRYLVEKREAMPIATLWHVILRTVQDWWQDNCLRLAASLAYHGLVPGAAGAPHRGRGRARARSADGHRLTAARRPHGAGRARPHHHHSHHDEPTRGALATIIGLVTLFIGATAVFGELQPRSTSSGRSSPRQPADYGRGFGPGSDNASSRWPLSLPSRSCSSCRSSS